MPPIVLEPVVECLRDAAADPDLWPKALPLITSALGGLGAACFVGNDQTGGVEWACIFGPVGKHKIEYLEHYAALDLYTPMLPAAGESGWINLSECLPQNVLRHSEWYQDFVQPCGISDVIGVQLCHAGPRHLFMGVQFERVQTPSS